MIAAVLILAVIVTVPLMLLAIISGTQDKYVPCKMARRMYDACCTNKYLLLVEGTGHSACYMMNEEGYANTVYKLIDNATNCVCLGGRL